jgi:hypothetical protein
MAACLPAILPLGGDALAHDLKANHAVLPDHRVLVYCWYNFGTGPIAARHAEVEIQRPGREAIRGTTDEKGEFTFAYDKIEEMAIVVRTPGHVNHPPDVISVSELEHGGSGEANDTPDESTDKKPDATAASERLHKSAEQSSLQLVKDLVLGVCAIFAVAAFVLSLRNARQLREIQKLLEERQVVEK